MEIERIIEQLRAERNRIDKAIAALDSSGSTIRTEHSKANLATAQPKKRGRRSMSQAERKRLSRQMKKRWAERKAQAKNVQNAKKR